MSSSKTRVMSVRVKNETADFFHDKPLNRIVESVHELAVKKEIEIDRGEVIVNRNNNT